MSDRQWYYSVSGKQEGPVSEERLLQMFETALLPADTIVWTPGFADWTPASSVDMFRPAMRNTPSMAVRQATVTPTPLYAGFWKRLAAAFLDSMILMV